MIIGLRLTPSRARQPDAEGRLLVGLVGGRAIVYAKLD